MFFQFLSARRRRAAGYTSIELLLALLLLGIVLGLLVPRGRHALDRLAVDAAAQTVLAGAARARLAAIAGGGAAFVLEPASGSVRLERDSTSLVLGELRADYGVSVDADQQEPIRIDYGPLGLGVVSSRSIRLARGGAAVRLVVSSYGRVRQW